MIESVEIAYYFNKNEFLLLLGLVGIGEIYSFELPSREEYDRETAALALHRLAVRGLVELSSERPVVIPALAALLHHIHSAARVLAVFPREGVQQICYLSEEQAVITELTEHGGDIRLSAVSAEAMWTELYEVSGILREPFATEDQGELYRWHQPMVQEEYQVLSDPECILTEATVFEILEQEQILAVWEFGDAGRLDEAHLRIVFRSGCMNTWISVETDSRQVYMDSVPIRERLQKLIEKGGVKI